jgi:hypothetical protein
MANYTNIPGVQRPNWVVKYTSSVGNKIRMCFIHEENMKEWIEAVTELNKMSGTTFEYTIEKAVD